MLKYARADTHFLLHIYDNLRNALLDRAVSRSASPTSRAGSPMAPDAFVREVLSRSAETALRVYTPESYDKEGGTGVSGWDTLARKWNKPALGIDSVPGVQRKVFREVHIWRDRVAREEDESTGYASPPSRICDRTNLHDRYVLSNRFVFKLVEQPPADMAALLHTFPSTPPVVRRRSKELLDVIRDAVKRGLSEAAEGPGDPLIEEPTWATVPLIKTEGGELSAPTPPVSQPLSLWSHNKALPTAATSSLFGSSTMPSRPHLVYSATTSSLFGTIPAPRINSHKRFQDVVKKIHNTLVIAPTVPTVRASC